MSKTQESTNWEESQQLLTFKNKSELVKVLESLPDEMVALIGYVDEHNIVKRFDKNDLSLIRHQARREVLEEMEKRRKEMSKREYSLVGHKDITKSINTWKEGYNFALDNLEALVEDLEK